ncbi:hypothetical protein S40288_10888 [Stachybotrys chartarum IBT 40288]|nr:hypothetical protein S40288_10888 [Stachybotrys chartarum IBT 40288]
MGPPRASQDWHETMIPAAYNSGKKLRVTLEDFSKTSPTEYLVESRKKSPDTKIKPQKRSSWPKVRKSLTSPAYESEHAGRIANVVDPVMENVTALGDHDDFQITAAIFGNEI